MPSTNRLQDRLKRVFWGLLGATLVVGPPVANWIDTVPTPTTSVTMVQYLTVVILGLSWLAALYLAYTEQEPHVWNVFFKSVGVPGTVVGVGHAFQLS